jgi:glycosyltransferase involved in cell wall biosynthesis
MIQTTFPKVAFLAGTLGKGGAEQQLFHMVEVLVKAGAEPAVVCLTQGEHWEAKIRGLGVPVYFAGKASNPGGRAFSVCATVRRLRPQVVQSAHFYTNLYTVAAAKLTGCTEVGAVRNDTVWSVRSLGRMGMPSLRWPRTLAVNSANAARQAVGLGVPSERVVLVPNAVDIDRFSPTCRCTRGVVHLLSVGRLVPQKRHDRFARLVQAVRAQAPVGVYISARIVGDGPEKEALAKQCPPGLEVVASEDVAAEYHKADIFVLTSDFEGTPNVVLEAMASGLPVVAFGIGGVPEVVLDDQTGLVVAPGDEEAMATAVSRLVAEPALRTRLGEAGRRMALQEHSPSGLAVNLQHLYTTAMRQT